MIIVRLVDLPPGIRGFTVPDENGDFNIYINTKISAFAQKKAYRHELEHIAEGDCYSNEKAGGIESARHK